MRWTRRKYEGRNRLGMPEIKRRFCGQGWRFAQGKVIFTGASSVTVKRYRYRGSNIPTPWTPKPEAAVSGGWPDGKDTWSARCLERGTPGAGGGLRETDGGNTEPRPQAYLTLPVSGPSLSCPQPAITQSEHTPREFRLPKRKTHPLTNIRASLSAWQPQVGYHVPYRAVVDRLCT